MRASTFNSNEAGNIVGAMCAYNNSGITVYNSSFEDGSAVEGVGVMCAYENSTIMVHNSFFNNNKAVGDEAGVLDAQHFSSVTVHTRYLSLRVK